MDNILAYNIDFQIFIEKKIDLNLLDLVKKFLTRNPKERLSDLESIKKHPYFKGE